MGSIKRLVKPAGAGWSRTTGILWLVIFCGGALTLWARWEIDRVLRVDPGLDINLKITEIQGDCGTPSVYIIPRGEDGKSDYAVLVDVLGGVNRFPRLGGKDTTPVLSLPASRPPGVGLGRSILQRCHILSMEFEALFDDFEILDAFPGLGTLSMAPMPRVARHVDDNVLQLSYRRPQEPHEKNTLIAFSLNGVRDRWQQGAKRVIFTNNGGRGVNVFFYEEDGYLFVNETNSLVRPLGTKRSYADLHLEGKGEASDNTVVVVRRRPTADIELQHELIGRSTIFGIGISLLVEGILFLIISFASRADPIG